MDDRDLIDRESEQPDLHDEEELEESEVESDEVEDEEPAPSQSEPDELDVDYARKGLKEREKLRRAFYSQLQKNQELEEKLNEANQRYNQSFDQNVAATGDRIDQEINRTKAKIALAVQDNNAYDVADANAELARLANERMRVEDWTRSRQEQQPPQQEENQSFLNPVQQSAIVSWVESNDDLDANSPAFNPRIADTFEKTATVINQRMIEAGTQHLIGTPEYLDLMDRVALDARRQVFNGNRPNVRGKSYTEPVRNSSQSSKNKITLSMDERRFAEEIEVSPEAFLKTKILRLQKERGGVV